MGYRIDFLDGMRGIAVIAVVIFHGYVAFPDTLPFGDRFGVLPFRLGWQGVELFFLISGFVILMTLERCESFFDFAVRRWLRLFPAMLIASVGVYLLFWAVKAQRPLIDLIPGLTFVSPSLIHSVTGLIARSMDDSYWTLYVEVAFYIVFGGSYFWAGEKIAIATVFLFFIMTVLARFAFGLALDSIPSRITAAAHWMGFVHFGWFASGSLFYLFFKSKRMLPLCLGLLAGFLAALTSGFPLIEKIGLSVLVVFFAMGLLSQRLQAILTNTVLVFVGFISYPLYLLHGDLVSFSLWPLATYLTPIAIPLPGIAISILLAWLLSKYGEPIVRSTLLKLFSHILASVERLVVVVKLLRSTVSGKSAG